MNYLAHSYLSNNDPGLLVGNFIADHIHGNHFEHLPALVIEGIKLHRQIDAFTDSHPKFKESKRFFYKDFEKYSGILVDIYFDHLLAKNFSLYTGQNLEGYSAGVYTVYQQQKAYLPKSSAGFLEYVLKNNIYNAYASTEGIETVLFHLSHRINHGVFLNKSMPVFLENETQLRQNFELFFDDARRLFLPAI